MAFRVPDLVQTPGKPLPRPLKLLRLPITSFPYTPFPPSDASPVHSPYNRRPVFTTRPSQRKLDRTPGNQIRKNRPKITWENAAEGEIPFLRKSSIDYAEMKKLSYKKKERTGIHRRISSESGKMERRDLMRYGNEEKKREGNDGIAPILVRSMKGTKTNGLLPAEETLVLPTGPAFSPSDERKVLIQYISNYSAKYKKGPKTSLQYYELGKLIGKGAFGKVITAIHKLTKETVAIKAIDKTLMVSETNRKKIHQEVSILSGISDPHVVKLLEVFESETRLLLVLEHAAGGDLLHYTKAKGRIPEAEAKTLFKEITEGLSAVHRSGVLHRDVKLENILLTSSLTSPRIKLCDFGISCLVQKSTLVYEECGTPAYVAPEVLSGQGYEGFCSDVWSLGVCLYTMINGVLPFPDKTEFRRDGETEEYQETEWMEGEVKELVERMLRRDPKQRISLQDVLSHPWLQPSDPILPSPEKSFQERQDLGDFYLDRQILLQMQDFGYIQDQVLMSLRRNELNHATATYYLLCKQFGRVSLLR